MRNEDPGDIELRERVRTLLAAGKLPVADAAGMWGGAGNDELCNICRLPIGPQEIVFDLLFRTSSGEFELHMHPRCHVAWERERGVCQNAPRPSAPAPRWQAE